MWSDKIFFYVCLFAGFLLLSCSEEEAPVISGPDIQTHQIAVIVPETKMARMKRLASWWQENMEKAQAGFDVQTKLEFQWINEDQDRWQEQMKAAVADEQVKAIIGPFYSEHAFSTAIECVKTNKTNILPSVTSGELQRMYAGEGFMWFISESDIAQSEIMLTNAQLNGSKGVSLLTQRNDYGQTFIDWVGFQATELGLKVYNTYLYENESELQEMLTQIEKDAIERNLDDPFQSLLFVPARPEDMKVLDDYLSNVFSDLTFIVNIFCSDAACDDQIVDILSDSKQVYEGFALSASPSSGFNQSYQIRFGENPLNAEAQFYDALLLAFYGLYQMEHAECPDLNEALKIVVDARDGLPCQWYPNDVARALTAISAGKHPDIEGTTGALEFDAKKYTSVLHSVFSHWKFQNGQYHTIQYETTDGSLRSSANSAVWDWAKHYQQFNPEISISYPATQDKWALIVATSTSWKNYRHQADAFAMYQLLKRHGVDDDHIVLIVSDTYAHDSRNLWPGEVRVYSDGENVYDQKAIDYDLRDLQPADLHDILSGRRSTRLPHVIEADSTDNVLVFWSGHGSVDKLLWGEDDLFVSSEEMRRLLQNLSDQHKFRQMLLAIEACYSGSVGKYCEGIPGVLFLTAANENESSWAEQKDPTMRIYLSNIFTRTFQTSIDEQPGIALRDLYYDLARTTSKSHVTIYNEIYFGNVFETPFTEWLWY